VRVRVETQDDVGAEIRRQHVVVDADEVLHRVASRTLDRGRV
jgi:hypothetical protein